MRIKDWFDKRQREREAIQRQQEIDAMKLRAYNDMFSYVKEHIAAEVGEDGLKDRKLCFVDKWAFELYELGLLPMQRYQDVKSAQDGYDNLLYKSTPITWKVTE